MLIACYMSLYCSKKSLSKEQWLMLVVLLVFGVLSGSFSFLLTTAVSMMAALMYMTRQNLLTMIRTTIVFMIVIGVVFLLMGDGAKMLISYRFESQMTNNDSLSNMTSGRSELQAIYLDYFKEHSTTVLLGDGLKAPNLGTMRRGPHNTFIDIIYYLGISGTIIYVGALISFMRVKVRFSQCKLYHWFPTASLLIRLMAISLLLLNNITFYYLLLWLALESRMRETTANPSPGSLAEVPGGRPIEKAPEGNLPRLKELKALE